jgi:1,4-dihydroxy-2-naphthoate octaprenyltransferase
MRGVRSYFKLLRLPYQLQLGPIFGWGYLLAGGHIADLAQLLHFAGVFALFHVGAFGGLTALNSYYDRDSGPIGGLWKPPPPPPRLLAFAWSVQLGGLLLLLVVDWRLAPIYLALVLLALGYSHPRTRWKGHPFKSVLVVAAGQGVLDYAAGALAAGGPAPTPVLGAGMLGAVLIVIGCYPLTQLYQVNSDRQRGDTTTALVLVERFGRSGVFSFAGIALLLGSAASAGALWLCGYRLDAAALLGASLLPLLFLFRWARRRQPPLTPAGGGVEESYQCRFDFIQAHLIIRMTAAAFACYIALRLLRGGLD